MRRPSLRRPALAGILFSIVATVATGCYQSHLADGAERCGDAICSEWEHCCVTCGEARCTTLDLPCPVVECDRCTSDGDCAAIGFCRFTSGTCGGVGACEPFPEGCTADCPGVCGCDGETYCNECEAARLGVSVDHRGACPTGELCGRVECPVDTICCPLCDGEGICVGAFEPCPDVDCPDERCFASGDCGPDEWCDFPDDLCGMVGTCRLRPRGCDDDCPGVCGCDGATYCNDCVAASVGVDLAPPETCAMPCGRGGRVCDPDEYCDLGPECGATDAWSCQDRPTTCPGIWAPVCGCDWVTYGNACLAAAAGVSIRYPDTGCTD